MRDISHIIIRNAKRGRATVLSFTSRQEKESINDRSACFVGFYSPSFHRSPGLITSRCFLPMKSAHGCRVTPRDFYRARISAAFQQRVMELIKYLSPHGGWTCEIAKLLASWLKSLREPCSPTRKPARVKLRLHRVIFYNN